MMSGGCLRVKAVRPAGRSAAEGGPVSSFCVRLSGLTKLEHLDLGGTQVTDASLAHLARLTKLENLSLGGTQVTGAGVAELRRKLPRVGVHR